MEEELATQDTKGFSDLWPWPTKCGPLEWWRGCFGSCISKYTKKCTQFQMLKSSSAPGQVGHLAALTGQ